MRMSRAMETFFELHVRARVTAKTGIRDRLFRSFDDSVNQKLIFIAQMVLVMFSVAKLELPVLNVKEHSYLVSETKRLQSQ